MHGYALAIILMMMAPPALACESWTVERVVDGDTIRVITPWGRERVRLPAVDAPESPGRARCAEEARLAMEATAAVRRLLWGAETVCWTWTGDAYGKRRDRYGRILARVAVDGRDLGQTLIEMGLAQPWPRVREWCR